MAHSNFVLLLKIIQVANIRRSIAFFLRMKNVQIQIERSQTAC